MYIQRKPHKNGLMIYQAVSYIDSPLYSDLIIPFIVDMSPHLIVGDGAPVDVVYKFMNR
jgi:hypothetical protein